MASNRNAARRQSVMIAFCGMAAGLSIVVMLLGGVIPVATYAVPMLCGLLLLNRCRFRCSRLPCRCRSNHSVCHILFISFG